MTSDGKLSRWLVHMTDIGIQERVKLEGNLPPGRVWGKKARDRALRNSASHGRTEKHESGE